MIKKFYQNMRIPPIFLALFFGWAWDKGWAICKQKKRGCLYLAFGYFIPFANIK
jgi:hypothetical protein